MHEQSLSSVSRETREKPLSSARPDGSVDRRRLPHALVERNGKMQRKGPAWTEAELATLRLLVEAGCTAKDIAAHFQATTQAVSMTMHRHGIKRPRPRVADVLRNQARAPESETPAAGGSASASGSASQVAVVDLLDDRSRYLCRVELHEIDERRQCRVRRVTGDGAGQWATFPLHRLAIPLAQRPAILEAARARHVATLERRAALSSSTTGATANE